MERSEFATEQQEYLVEVGRGYAFVPPPIPLDLPIPRAMLLKDGDARGALGELVGESRRIEAALLLAPLRRREAVLSNVIEGTYTQVEEVLLGEATGDSADMRAETTEVLRTIDAIEIGQHWLEEGRPLSTSLVLELHAALLRHGRGERRHPGEFRSSQVYLGSPGGNVESARYVPPPPEQVRPLFNELIAFIDRPTVYGPLIDAALMHYQFEAIHPFEDGNGRLGRALIPLFLIGRSVIQTPILYLGAYFAANREQYIELLGAVSKKGAWETWLEFFLEGVIREAREADQRLRRVNALVAKYRPLVSSASRSTSALSALDVAFDQVYLSVGQVASRTGVSVPTARNAIATLESVGFLRLGPRLRGKQYWVAQEVIDELYRL
ncbi:MAG: Fic family protein [bacterium]